MKWDGERIEGQRFPIGNIRYYCHDKTWYWKVEIIRSAKYVQRDCISNNLKPIWVPIDKLIFKYSRLDEIKSTDLEYINADLNEPMVAMETNKIDMSCSKLEERKDMTGYYRLMRGKYHLKKHIDMGNDKILLYIVKREQAYRHYEGYEKTPEESIAKLNEYIHANLPSTTYYQ
tara:strand:- start:77 stop:598 length:522 start_codon:yes stop_codon:yes gene_type:complete